MARHHIQPGNVDGDAGDYYVRTQIYDDDGNVVDFDTQTITTTNDSVDATGSTVPAKATFVAGTDGTNTTALKVDSDGNLQTEVLQVPTVASTTVTQVGDSATSVTLKASNSARKGLTVYNDSTAALYLKLGATASTSSFTAKIDASGYWEMPANVVYTGVVDGIWTSDAGGSALVTEL